MSNDLSHCSLSHSNVAAWLLFHTSEHCFLSVGGSCCHSLSSAPLWGKMFSILNRTLVIYREGSPRNAKGAILKDLAVTQQEVIPACAYWLMSEVGNEGRIDLWFSCQRLAFIAQLAPPFAPSDIVVTFLDKLRSNS